jgi:hypothetical protein
VHIDDQPSKRKRTPLAEAIERDILADRKPDSKSQECFTCGRPFLKLGERFCSEWCRESFDAGAPPHDPIQVSKSKPRWYSLPIGRHGFLIDCRGCGRTFDNVGLRCCSTDCERSLRRKEQLDAELADDPFRAVKRKCAGCGGDIPNWRNGRRVSKATEFCSRRCRDESARMATGSSKADSRREISKKCPENGGPR